MGCKDEEKGLDEEGISIANSTLVQHRKVDE